MLNFLCWVCAFANMGYVFHNLFEQHYAAAWFNFWIAYALVRQQAEDMGPVTESDEDSCKE